MEEITLNEEDSSEIPEYRTKNEDADQVAELKLDNDEEKEETIEHEVDSSPNNDISDTDNGNDVPENNEENETNLMDSLIEKLRKLELQNSEYLNENENQRKVIEMLRCEVTKKDEEVVVLERDFSSTKQSLEAKIKSMGEESSRKISELQKAFDRANKDKESMVIKYAMGEKDILIAKKGKDDLEKKLKDALKDNESYQYKVKTLGTERTRLQGLCEQRGQETNTVKKDLEKLREEIKLTDAKLTVANNKLKAEVDAHQSTKENLDRTFKELMEVQGSIDDIKQEYSDLISKAKHEDEEKKKKEKIQEKEQSVKLMIDNAAAAELESLKKRHKEAIDENNELSVKVQSNEKDLLSYETSMSELKEVLAKQKSEIVDLYSQCAELESVKVQLNSETEKVTARDSEISRLRSEASDMMSDMASCRRKEGELLEFTQKLTDKNVTLQSEFSSVESRAATLEEEHSRIVEAHAETESRLTAALQQLESESCKRREETELLARKLAEKVKMLETANQKVIDAKNDVDVVKRQNQARVRELNKELVSVKKRLEAVEEAGEMGECRESSPGQLSSRCSSSSSLSRDSETVTQVSPSNGADHLHTRSNHDNHPVQVTFISHDTRHKQKNK